MLNVSHYISTLFTQISPLILVRIQSQRQVGISSKCVIPTNIPNFISLQRSISRKIGAFTCHKTGIKHFDSGWLEFGIKHPIGTLRLPMIFPIIHHSNHCDRWNAMLNGNSMDDFIPLKSPFQDGSIVDEYHHESPVIVDYHPLSISSISMIQWNMYSIYIKSIIITTNGY